MDTLAIGLAVIKYVKDGEVAWQLGVMMCFGSFGRFAVPLRKATLSPLCGDRYLDVTLVFFYIFIRITLIDLPVDRTMMEELADCDALLLYTSHPGLVDRSQQTRFIACRRSKWGNMSPKDLKGYARHEEL